MAYVEPRGSVGNAFESVLRNGARAAAIAAYATALAVALLLLAPVLFERGQAPVVLPVGPKPIHYTVKRGETLAGVAARHGLSLERFFTLNRGMTPFTADAGNPVVVGWR
jgi:LysM repeat protein